MIILVWICINSWNTVYPLVCPIPSQLCCFQRCNFLGHTKWMVSRRRCACLATILATPLVSILVNLRLFCTTFHVAGRNDDERVPQANFRICLRLANWYLFEVIVYQMCNFFSGVLSKILRFSSTLGSSTLLIPLCEFYVLFFLLKMLSCDFYGFFLLKMLSLQA